MAFDLIETIEKALPGMSKGQKRIAAFIIEHCEQAAYMTASRLGATVGVSESTVALACMRMSPSPPWYALLSNWALTDILVCTEPCRIRLENGLPAYSVWK